MQPANQHELSTRSKYKTQKSYPYTLPTEHSSSQSKPDDKMVEKTDRYTVNTVYKDFKKGHFVNSKKNEGKNCCDQFWWSLIGFIIFSIGAYVSKNTYIRRSRIRYLSIYYI